MKQAAKTDDRLILVLGGTDKTGRRIVERLAARGERVRAGSRNGTPPFDWEDAATWAPVLRGAGAVYLSYYPDLAVPGAVDAVRSLVDLAERSDVRRLVLLAGRGEEEAERAEQVVRASGLDWTILRASWFAQNFSESYLRDPVVGGEVVLPAGDTGEPFIDADDIADVAVAALTEAGHGDQLYELTGPRSLTFAEAVATIARATGREIRYVDVPPDTYAAALAAEGVSANVVWLMDYLFTTILDGRNAQVMDGIQRALGREPRDLADFARHAAATGAWHAPVDAKAGR